MCFQKVGFLLKPCILGDIMLLISNPNGGFKTTIRAPYGGLLRPFEPLQLKMTKE
jgi:hypothetical protein